MTLPTPNLVLPESAGFNLSTSSPRQYKIRHGLIGSNPMTSNEERETMIKEEQSEDMLTTPVLTTPKTGDLWSQLRNGSNEGRSPNILGNRFGPAHDPHAFSPENLTVTSPTPIEIGPRDPPNDLPMDSEIGLRSPCDGLLAQRRRERFRDKKQLSSVDSNSMSDTPTSENNSPRDLTMGSSRVRLGSSKSESEKSVGDGLSAGCDNSGNVGKSLGSPVSTTSPTSKLSNTTSSNTNSIQTESISNCTTSATTLSTSNHNNNVLERNKPPNIEVQEHGSRGSSTNSKSPVSPHLQKREFKLPGTKPENLRILNGSSNGKDGTESSSEHPSHYTPSPLAVPSPNWTAVERYFGSEYVLRTPRLLDISVFDFRSQPYSSGMPSGSAKSRFPRSPGNEAERYLGWDQHLSPRLSPRFPIPEKPEDLSNGSSSRSGSTGERKPGDPPPYAEAAEDLSTKRQQKQSSASGTQQHNSRMSSSPTTNDSDSNGGGPASNLSSASPITPPSPMTYPSHRNPMTHLQTSNNPPHRHSSSSPINGIQNLLSKTNILHPEPRNQTPSSEANPEHDSNHVNQVKQKYISNKFQDNPAMQLHQTRVKTEATPSNIHSATHPPPLQGIHQASGINMPIKSEVEDFEYNTSDPRNQSQLPGRQVHQADVSIGSNTSSNFGNPYYITQGFPPFYNRHQEQSIYPNHLANQQQRPSPPTSAPPPKISPPPPLITGNNHIPPHTRMSVDYNRSSPLNGGITTNSHIRHSVSPYSSSHHTSHGQTNWNRNPSPGLNLIPHQQTISQQQPNNDISNIHARSLQHQWTTPSTLRNDDESSISPPSHHLSLDRGMGNNSAGISVKPSTTLLNRNHGMFGGLQNGSLSSEKKRGRKPGGPIAHDAINHTSERNGDNSHGDMGGPGGSKKPRKSGGAKKASAKVEGEENGATAAGGNKRSYSCPHCQRSYDWNYNLNRHLKYECGKENAFQCAKCGRKFPHKQNCVYHLKRKHKIVCETIDQYVAAGLVVFNGSSNPGGQGSGKGEDEGMMNNSGLLPASMSQGHTQLQPITTTMTSTRVA